GGPGVRQGRRRPLREYSLGQAADLESSSAITKSARRRRSPLVRMMLAFWKEAGPERSVRNRLRRHFGWISSTSPFWKRFTGEAGGRTPGWGGLRGVPRVDCEPCPGDVSGFVAQKKLDSVPNVICFDQTSKRAAARDLLAVPLAKTFGHVGLNKSGGHRINVDAQGTDLSGQRPGKTYDRGLGGAVH